MGSVGKSTLVARAVAWFGAPILATKALGHMAGEDPEGSNPLEIPNRCDTKTREALWLVRSALSSPGACAQEGPTRLSRAPW